MEIRRCEPSFGMVRYGSGVEEHIRKMGHYKAIEFRVIGIKNRENPIEVNLSIIKKRGKDRLKAEVGNKSYVETWYRNPICVISKAVKNANKIFEHQQEVKNVTEGMSRPTALD